MQIDLPATTLNYELDGPAGALTLVLTHGLGGSLDAWQPLSDALSDRYQVLRWDVRGFGRSSRSGPLNPQTWADDLAALLAALEIDSAVIAGISMGGVIAQRFALDHPRRTRALILMSTSSEVGQAGRAGWEARAQLVEREGMAALMDQSGPSISYSAAYAEANQDLIQRAAQETAARNDPACYAEACRAVSTYNYTPELARIDCPTLILQGLDDTLTPPGGSVIMSRQIPNARLEMIPGCGHGIPAERPQELLAQVESFLASLA